MSHINGLDFRLSVSRIVALTFSIGNGQEISGWSYLFSDAVSMLDVRVSVHL